LLLGSALVQPFSHWEPVGLVKVTPARGEVVGEMEALREMDCVLVEELVPERVWELDWETVGVPESESVGELEVVLEPEREPEVVMDCVEDLEPEGEGRMEVDAVPELERDWEALAVAVVVVLELREALTVALEVRDLEAVVLELRDTVAEALLLGLVEGEGVTA